MISDFEGYLKLFLNLNRESSSELYLKLLIFYNLKCIFGPFI